MRAWLMPVSWIKREETLAGNRIIEGAQAICDWAGIVHKARIEFGDIAARIEAVAKDGRADQVVMGTRGLGSVPGFLMGSAASRVLHVVDIPVTLVK